MSKFDIIFKYKARYPDLGFYDGIDEVARLHTDEVLAELPRVQSLPSASELTARPVGDIFVIEPELTVGALRAHLAGANSRTSEFLFTLSRQGLQVVEIGDHEGANRHFIWRPFLCNALMHVHTHPNPTNRIYSREPSLVDLTTYVEEERSGAIASPDGLTYVPMPIRDPVQAWIDFEASNSDPAISQRDLYSQYIAQVVRPRFVEWVSLPDVMPVTQAVLLQSV